MGVASGNVGLAFGLVFAAGLSTTLGSALVFVTDKANVTYLAAALGTSAGVMLCVQDPGSAGGGPGRAGALTHAPTTQHQTRYVSFAEIFTVKAVEAFQESGYKDGEAYAYATITFFSGIVFTYILDQVVHFIGEKSAPPALPAGEGGATRVATLVGGLATCFGLLPQGKAGSDGEDAEAVEVTVTDDRPQQAVNAPSPSSDTLAESDSARESEHAGCPAHGQLPVPKSADATQAKPEELQKMGVMTGIAIALHNFPEGLATFVATLADEKLGIAIALAIAMHNIPEGVCVAFPVYYATGSRWKGFMWSFLSGVTEPIGGLLGYLVLYGNAMSDLAYGVLFGIVGGMMVYISLKELIPMALKYDPKDRVTMNCCFVGMAVMALSLVLFQV